LPLIPVPTTATRIFGPPWHAGRYGGLFPEFQIGHGPRISLQDKPMRDVRTGEKPRESPMKSS
jgi:hypothetical protein